MKIKEFQDGSYLEYAAGNFDQWCVYMVNPSKNFRRPPLDVDYFGFLREQAKIFGSQKIYDDFVSIYNLTSNQVEGTVLDYIRKISLAGYGEKWLEFEKVYTILYMGMIAEENKAYTKLGKRIKRLGIYKLLIENESVATAANFMRGMRFSEIDVLCKKGGF